MTDIAPYLSLLEEMIGTPSTSGDEKAVADLLQRRMEALGLDVRRVGDNLWVDAGGEDKPILLLNAHIDTVRPSSGYTRDPFKASREGDRLYGLGSNDDGGSLVALLAAYVELVSRTQPYRLVFSATAGEENGDPEGFEAFLRCMDRPAFGIIGEPTGMRMAVAEKGLVVLDCVARGKSGHVALGDGVNALYEALDDIQWFRNYRFDKVSDFLGPVRMSVTMVQAGSQHNVVPDECRFVVDVRPNGEYTNEELLLLIRSHVACEVEPRSLKHRSSVIAKDHPVVRRGLSLGLSPYGSPTASNRSRCGFPTLKIGPGDSARSHSADEYIGISEIEEAVGIYVRLLDGLDIR